MAITTYSELKAAVERWIDRDVSDTIEDCIALAEARLRDLVTMPEAETVATITPGVITPAPDDFDSARLMFMPGAPSMRIITQVSPADLYNRSTAFAGQPTVFAYVGDAFVFSPEPDTSYAATLIYQANLPALSDATPTNWLLKKRPDIYLYATLLEAEAETFNDERVANIKAMLDEKIGDLNAAGNRKRYGGQIYARPLVQEAVRGAYRGRY